MKFRDSWYYQSLRKEIDALPGPGHFPAHAAATRSFLDGLPDARGNHAYAPGKWTLTEVAGHFTDAQLVFLGRILFIARGETAILPGFDENKWVPAARHGALGLPRVRDLYAKTSALTEALLASLPAESLQAEGIANGMTITVEEILLYMMAHEAHHIEILRTRYSA